MPKGVYIRNNPPWNKGKIMSEDYRQKCREINKGRIVSEETKRKMSEAHKGNHYSLGRKLSEEHKRKIGEFFKGNKYNLGRILSLEHRRKISEAGKGRTQSLETRKKLSDARKGKPMSENTRLGLEEYRKQPHVISEETRKKLSECRKGRPHLISDEARQRLIIFNKNRIGWKQSPEAKMKISKAGKGRTGYWKGKHPSLETRKKISEQNKGSKSYLWKGGISFEPYGLEFNEQLKEQIRKRDNHKCQNCFKHQDEFIYKNGRKDKLDVHHIDYDKKNSNLINLISLCKGCHTKTNQKRAEWSAYFQRLRAA